MMIMKVLIAPLILMLTEVSVGWETTSIIDYSQINILTLTVYWIYFALLESFLGGTFGKLFVRLRVYSSSSGTKISIFKALLRFPLKVISIISVFGVLMIDITKEKQGLHDLICGTIVRRK